MPHSAKFVTTQRLRLSKKLIGARDSGSGDMWNKEDSWWNKSFKLCLNNTICKTFVVLQK